MVAHALGLPILLAVVGVALPRSRPAVHLTKAQRHGVKAPAELPSPPAMPPVQQLSTAAPLANGQAAAAAASSALTHVNANDMISTPSILAGMSPSGQLFEQPAQLGREEELDYVRKALFYIASTDAQRALADHTRASAAALAFTADSLESPSDEDSEQQMIFNHEEIIAEMRRASEEAAQLAKANRKKGRTTATMVPCDVPTSLTDTEYRLRMASGRAAYNRLFHHNQKLVYYEVNKIWPNWQRATVMEKADFLQEGAQGLLRAIRLFDTARGVRFSTYASWHVRAFVLRALRDKSHIVRLPQTLQSDMNQINKARYRYAVENQGHAPDNYALASMLQWPAARVEEALKGLAGASATSLDAETSVVGSDRIGEPLGNRVASPKHGPSAAENELYQNQLQQSLKAAMANRDPRRTKITRLKYGLEDGVEWTYHDLAQRFNVTLDTAKHIVRAEVNFLRRSKKRELQEFVGHY